MFRVDATQSPTSVATTNGYNSRFEERCVAMNGRKHRVVNNEDDHTETNLDTIIYPARNEEESSVLSSTTDTSYSSDGDTTTFRTLDYSDQRTCYTRDDDESASYRTANSLELLKKFAEKQLGLVENFFEKFQCKAGFDAEEGMTQYEAAQATEDKDLDTTEGLTEKNGEESIDLREIFQCKARLARVEQMIQKNGKLSVDPEDIFQCKASLDALEETKQKYGEKGLDPSEILQCKAGIDTTDGTMQKHSSEADGHGDELQINSGERNKLIPFKGQRNLGSELYKKYLTLMQETAEEQRIRLITYAADRFSHAADLASSLKEKYKEKASPAVKSRVISEVKVRVNQ